MGETLLLFRRRLAFVTDWLRKVQAILRPDAPQVSSQRVCPFCGLITPRHRASCLECGKTVKAA
jgi:hypothetical protein